MFKQIVAVAAMTVVALAGVAQASEGNGGKGGKGGHGGRGGHGGHGHHGGGHGGKGGGKGTTPSVAVVPAAPVSFGGGITTGTGLNMGAEAKTGLLNTRQAQTDSDTRDAMRLAGHEGLVQIDRINVDGSFTYSGYEWAVVAFAQQMKLKGYDMGTTGEDSTNLSNGLKTDALGG